MDFLTYVRKYEDGLIGSLARSGVVHGVCASSLVPRFMPQPA